MKYFNFKQLLPHLIAIGVFLLVAVIFCKPALEADTVLKQGDIAGWQGMSHQSFEYKEQHGHFPLWITNMFSGMPAYQVAIEGAWSPLSVIDQIFQLWLPQPLNFFFLACIGFYFLCICLRVRTFPAIIGSLAFAYCSFSPIIVTAGHNTQMLALGYAPAVLGSAILLFDKKYVSGFTFMTLFTALQIGQSHQQISYYLFIVLGFMAIAYIIHFIKTHQTSHLLKSIGFMLVAGMIGIAVNAISLLPVYDFSKDSKRGGQLVMDSNVKKGEKVVDGKTKGLSKDYAFMWSYGKGETWSLMFPGVKGYGTHFAERDGEQYLFPQLDENSYLATYLMEKLNMPPDQATNIAMQQSRTIYWGDQPFTNGPVYLGAIICFLFILGMFYLDNKHKWWILAASVFGILLSWGSNLAGFNYLVFDYFPLYNKFRVPTMALVIPQLLFPVIASLVMNKLLENKDADGWQKFKKGLFATAAIFILVTIYYISSNFSKENKQRTSQFNQVYNPNDKDLSAKLSVLDEKYKPGTDNLLYESMVTNMKESPDAQKTAREFITALRKDRATFLKDDIIRSLIFVLIAAGLIALYLKKKVNGTILLTGVALATLIDLLGFGMKYLNEKSFDSKERYEASEFPVSAADRTILEDKDPNFRVYNTRSLEESKTSYYHKSIGGYHPAKLGIYDDLMAYQLSGSPNISVINMLNAKYVIQQQADNNLVALQNPGALGNAWFIKGIVWVDGPVAEMRAMDNFDSKDTAIVDKKYQPLVKNFSPADSADQITMTSFDNDAISYKSNATAARVAVFSEIYYKDWKAYIDGKPADYFKANYVLRAMEIPPGTHIIDFKFEPKLFYASKTISLVFSWLILLILLAYIAYEIRKNKPGKA